MDGPVHDVHKSILDGLDMGHLTAHLISIGAIFGVVLGILPALAALGAVVWYAIAIYETKTFQAFLQRRRERKAAKQ